MSSKVGRQLAKTGLLAIPLLLLVAGFWIAWPEFTILRFNQLVAAGKYKEAAAMLKCGLGCDSILPQNNCVYVHFPNGSVPIADIVSDPAPIGSYLDPLSSRRIYYKSYQPLGGYLVYTVQWGEISVSHTGFMPYIDTLGTPRDSP